MSDKRKFSRINFPGKCLLNGIVSDESKKWESKLLDISLKGALIKRPDFLSYKENDPIQLQLSLEGSDITLEFSGVICHQEKDRLGIKFLTLSLESISHLKRLIQLNLGDENLLHREMSQLINISDE
ncbi:MAG: PilZ domain-containing protein [Psychromonas sp.]|nr:PilZ domain-containing protein [Psychromonas sp.]